MTETAKQEQVREHVATAVAECDAVVDLKGHVGAAVDADSITFSDAVADLAPSPPVRDLAPELPVVAKAGTASAA